MSEHEFAAYDVGTNPADQQYRETPAGAGYEHTDANVFVVIKFGLWLAVSAIVIHFGLGLMYKLLIEQSKAVQEQRYPLATAADPRLPPSPRLQQFPRNEMYQMRLDEQKKLDGYGWVDRNAGTVRIPVSEAMRLTLERGLPARAQDPAQPAETPGMMPQDSSSGRTMERRRQ